MRATAMKRLLLAAGAAALMTLVACGPQEQSGEGLRQEVNIYSARQENLIKPLLDIFSEQTGIRVNLVTGGADEMITRLQLEGRNSPADILLTVDAGRLHRALELGLLQPVTSVALQQSVPARFRDPDNYWFAMSLRSRVLVYNRERVDPAELSSYEALVEPQWQGRVCIRSSSNVYNQSLVAAMIEHHGEEATEEWARGLVANFARDPQGGDRDQIAAVSVGQCDVAVVNTYYLAGMLNSPVANDRETAASVGLFWPNQDSYGAHINASGAGLAVNAPNPQPALQLLEFLVSDQAQAWYAEANNEYPVREDIGISDTLAQWGDYRADELPLRALGDNNAAAVRLMDRAGWR